ncbi:MAG: hypothetical protein ABII21_04440 [bacterium]
MPIIYSVVIFIILVIALSTLRTRLVYELSGASLLLFGSTRPGLILYSILVLPGTIIHELSHWLTAEILQVRTGPITILPDLNEEESSQRLGSVATAASDPLRGFLIGIAPFCTGTLILMVLGSLLRDGWAAGWTWWILVLLIYGLIVVGNSMLISTEDRRSWPITIILTTLVILALKRAGVSIQASSTSWLSTSLLSVNLILGVTTGLNLVMIGGSYITRRIVEKMTKRRLR